MTPARDWIAARGDESRPWLIYGKGPTFGTRSQYDTSKYLTLGLNHVCREQPVTLAHIIDLDVVDACGEALFSNAQAVVMPWWPHTKNRGVLAGTLQAPTKLSPQNLDELSHSHPILARLRDEGRLLWYNLSSGPRHGDEPVVEVRYFSSEAALNLLAAAGVRTVRSLGIDGGASYSGEFSDLRDKTLLANGRTTFDVQFGPIARTIMTTGLDYAPLDVESPIRVYVATTDAQMLSVKVLEYSIRKHASMTVQLFPMHLSNRAIPPPKDPKNLPRTPFSFQRFLIPELAGYRGRAVYLDSDMQVFRDMRELWTLPFDGASLLAAREPSQTGRRPQYSVMLLDCAQLDWNIDDIVARLDAGQLTYESLMYDMAVAPRQRAGIEPYWNSLERFVESETRLVHYTDMGTQPWVSTANPLGSLWMRDLFEAIDAGFLTRDEVADHITRGWVRPSLLYQIDQRDEVGRRLPPEVVAADAAFQAPFEEILQRGDRRGLPHLARAAARRAYHTVRRRLRL
jgi:Glycosyl transferase family 8